MQQSLLNSIVCTLCTGIVKIQSTYNLRDVLHDNTFNDVV